LEKSKIFVLSLYNVLYFAMRYNDAEEKSFDWQLEKSYKHKIRGQNFSNKLSYPDKLTIITMNDGKRRMTIKEWMEVDPETLYDYVFIKRKAFIANAIFDKLVKKLNLND